MVARKGTRRTSKPRLSKTAMLRREKAIIADIKAGKLSYRQIAAKHSVSLPTVNNKARKAGISRGRRPGAKILVAPPSRAAAGRKAPRRGVIRAAKMRKVARKAKRKATRKAARKAVGRVVRKAARRPRRQALPIVADLPMRAAARRRRLGSRRTPRRGRGVRAPKAGFMEAMRDLILRYHPNMSLRSFDSLMRSVQAKLS